MPPEVVLLIGEAKAMLPLLAGDVTVHVCPHPAHALKMADEVGATVVVVPRDLLARMQSRSDALATMSHELRTALQTVLADSEGVPALQSVASSARHLVALIDELLDLSRLEAGRMVLRIGDFEVGALVRDVERTVQAMIGTNRLEVAIAPDAGDMLGDETRLRQILLNLLHNANKFTEHGVVRLAVMPQNGGLQFKVSDTGIGMSAEQVEHAFTEFWQADARPHGGSGLGLAICRRFCEMMGGRIGVVSAPGQGTTFSVWVPRMVDPPETKP